MSVNKNTLRIYRSLPLHVRINTKGLEEISLTLILWQHPDILMNRVSDAIKYYGDNDKTGYHPNPQPLI